MKTISPLHKSRLAGAEEFENPDTHLDDNRYHLCYHGRTTMSAPTPPPDPKTGTGDLRQELLASEQALPQLRAAGDKAGEAATLTNIGGVYSDLADKQQALHYFEQALPLQRQVGDRRGEASTLTHIGAVYSDLGDQQQALHYFEQALPLRRQVGDQWGDAVTRYHLAITLAALGDLGQAEDELQTVVTIDEATGRPDLQSDRAALEQIRRRRRQGEDTAAAQG